MRSLTHSSNVPQIGTGEPSRASLRDFREAEAHRAREAAHIAALSQPEPKAARDRLAIEYDAQPLDARTPRLPVPVDHLNDQSLADFRVGLLAQLAQLEAQEAADLAARQGRLDAQGAAFDKAISAVMALIEPFRQVEPLLAQHRRDAIGAVARTELALEGIGGLRAEFCDRRASPDHGAILSHPIRHALRLIEAECKRRDVERTARAARLDEVKSLLAEAGIEL
jgi:hypothetical protein